MRKTIFKKLETKKLIANYNRYRKNLPNKIPDKVFFWDETLREGIQTPTVFLTYVEKVKLAKMMDEIGISLITVGFPAISKEEKEDVRKIANENFNNARLAASARINIKDIDACFECGIKEIKLFTAFNELNLKFKLKMTKEQVLEKTVESIKYAKKHGATINFLLEDTSRTRLEDIIEIYGAALNAGADRLVIADTVGFLRPLSMQYLVSHIKKGLIQTTNKKIKLSIHCHNDFGLATANTLAAVETGVDYIHTSIAGFGERAGITPLEEVVLALELLYKTDTKINVKKLYRLSQLAEKSFALPIQHHKPIVGENAFSYEVDEHIHVMLENPMTYEPFPPKMVDRETKFFFGRLAEKQYIINQLKIAGIKFKPWQVDEIVRRIKGVKEQQDKGGAQMTFYQIKKLMRELQKGLTEEMLWRIVEDVTRQKPRITKKKY